MFGKSKNETIQELNNDNEIIEQEKEYCILPLRDIVIFPSMIIPVFIGRGKSIATIEASGLVAFESL